LLETAPLPLTFTQITTGLLNPTDIAHAGDNRLFVTEKRGRIRIVNQGVLLATPFLDIQARVESDDLEEGLESLVFPPDYATTGVFYVLYTATNNSVHLSRFRVDPNNPNQATPDSEEVLLFVPQPDSIHNGADLLFGPDDGYLYVGMGDGGPANDPYDQGQSYQSLRGKILRLAVTAFGPYTIPPDNPYATSPYALPEIWALGLRNPWRMSFDRLTHDLWISDVGNYAYEEVNFQPANYVGGANYGWRCYEGHAPFNLFNCSAPENYVFPIHVYGHHNSDRCAITGGYVYRGGQIPSLYGQYLFSDHCSGEFWGLTRQNNQWQVNRLGLPVALVSTFGEGRFGELYVAEYFTGRLLRIAAP
jgi:glucose/arabinose dehydrogenase